MRNLSAQQLQHAYRYAMSLTNDHDVAMDIVHTAYTHLLTRGTGDVSNEQGYFFAAYGICSLTKKRFDDRWLIVDEADQPQDIDLRNLEALVIDQDLLAKLWTQLKPLERELLYLWAVEEYTIDEISHLTETSRGTLLSRVHRIRKKWPITIT